MSAQESEDLGFAVREILADDYKPSRKTIVALVALLTDIASAVTADEFSMALARNRDFVRGLRGEAP